MGTVVVEGGPVWLYVLGRLVEIGLLIFFTSIWLLTMQRALDACIYSRRTIQPGQVWLTFIPLFGVVWQFIAVTRVSETLALEYNVRGWKSDESRPGIEAGIVACCVVLIVLIVRLVIRDLNPGIGFLTTLCICLCMFMHRDRVKAFTERLDIENQKAQKSFAFGNMPNAFQHPQFPLAPNFPPQQIPYQQYEQSQFPPWYNHAPQYPQPPQQAPPVQNPYQPPNPYQPSANPTQEEQQPSAPDSTGTNRWQPPRQ